MFRDTSITEPSTTFWRAPEAGVAPARTRVAAFAEDEIGAVWHVYREIAQRIPRKAYTRHASMLGKPTR
jgi:hypothetical protein